MTQFHVLARRLALAATVACVFAGTLSAWPSAGEARKPKTASPPAGPSAQGPQGGDDAAQKVAAAEAAKKAYDTGLKEYAAGKYQSAIAELSTAVKSGTLTSSQMAKALVTRGLAYKKDNKPGQSISDLTSAIWLKNGLSPAEQKSAIAERSEAYQMAGLQDTGSTPDQRAIGAPAPASASAPASNGAANSASAANSGSAGLSAAAIAEAAGAQKAAGPQGTSATVTSEGVDGETTLQSAASPGVATADAKPASSGIGSFFGWGQSSQAAAPAPEAPSSGSSFTQSVTSIPGNVSGFFSNMFSSGSSAPAPDASQSIAVMTTTSTAGAAPETSSWSSATTVANRSQPEVIKAEKASFAPESRPKTAALTKGKFKIHIAAVRSKAEAEALAQKLVAEHGAELGNHVPVVDEAVIGSMGTFYRVRIGGYASQDEPRGLCNKLRTSGLDCLVVTN